MNAWKISTLGLTAVCAILGSKDLFSTANAATGAANSPSSVSFDWGVEQPHMEQALKDLRGAHHSLEVAAEHKGGWRALALKHTDEAIAETQRGMEYARNHPRE